MRGLSGWAVAVRNSEGQIEITSEALEPWAKRRRLWRVPIIRGVVALAESMKIGFGALAISANAQLEEDEDGNKEELGGWVWGVAIFFSLLFAVGLFFAVPVGLTSLIKDQLGSAFLFWLVEGIVRTAIFVGYLAAISRMPDLRRVFEYHGAEHKTISCYEAEDDLVPARAKLYSRLHPRCGTSFLPHPRHPADRGHLLRGDQVGGQTPPQALGARRDVAGPDAAEPDHEGARRRAARGGDRVAEEGARRAGARRHRRLADRDRRLAGLRQPSELSLSFSA
jgi:uncharacterized protein DUF1385